MALDTTDTDPCRTLLEILRISRRAHSTSELRTLLRARGFKKSDYEVTQHLRVLRTEGSVSLDRRRWSIQDVAPKTISIPSAHNVNGAPTSIPQSGQPLPTIDSSWAPRKSWMFEGAEIPEAKVQSVEQDAFLGPWGAFRRLLGYYMDCVRMNEGIEANANVPELGTRYTVIRKVGNWYPTPGKKWSHTIPASENSHGLFRSLESNRETRALVLGYPTWFYSDNPEYDSFFKPIFTYQLNHEYRSNGIYMWSDDPMPDINYDWLQRSLKSNPNQQSAFLTVAGLMNRTGDEEVASDNSSVQIRPDFLALATAVTTFFSDSVCEPLQPHSLSNLLSTDRPKRGIHNIAVIMSAERSNMTKGLLKELADIQKCPDDQLDTTSLRKIFKIGSPQSNEEDKLIEETDGIQRAGAGRLVVDNVELNSEQRGAVASLINNDITVVTGPPGTGKSQVVVSALANIRLKNQTALFASHNHKAIDAVVLRPEIVTDGDMPIVVRANSKEDRSIDFNFSKAIGELLSKPHDSSSIERLGDHKQELEKHLRARDELTSRANVAVDFREQIARLETKITHISGDWSEDKIQSLDNNCRDFPIDDVISLERYLKQLPDLATAERFWRRLLLWVFSWPSRKLGRKIYGNLADKYPAWSLSELGKGLLVLRQLVDRIEHLRNAASYCQYRLEQRPIELQAANVPPVDELYRDVEKETEKIVHLAQRALSSDTEARVGFPPNADRQQMGSLRAALSRFNDPLLDKGIRIKAQNALEEHLPRLLWHYPVWAITNLSVSSRIPLVPGMFDLAILDEASACGVPSAIPILFRAKRAGVIGDDYQLPPVRSMSQARDNILFQTHQLSMEELRFSDRECSLYKLFSQTNGIYPIWLRDHFRCAFGIAEYANQSFYGNRLRIATVADRLKIPSGQTPGIHWTEIESVAEKQHACPEEAEECISLLQKLLIHGSFEGTIGVVTPFKAQKELITQLIYGDSELNNAAPRAKLIVDTAHGFQGDERDVMVLSLCGGPHMQGKTKEWFNKEKFLFNVAVTRARAVLHIIGNKRWAEQCGIPHIQKLTRTLEPPQIIDHAVDGRFESPWERRLYYALAERGIKPIPQYPVLGRRLDFALIEKGKQKIDLEVDGARFHMEPDGTRRRDDIWRDITLEGAGWKVMRFWVHELRDQMDDCLNKIEKEWGAA